jgi:hypothetical protein
MTKIGELSTTYRQECLNKIHLFLTALNTSAHTQDKFKFNLLIVIRYI